MEKTLPDIYNELYETYGPQGWWPLLRKEGNRLKMWYHRGEYDFPRNENEVFEICVGAILTQNTNWNNVEKALTALYRENLLNATAILRAEAQRIKTLIRPAGYFNQKTRYLKNFSEFFLSLHGCIPTRKELLEVKGIGNETADSMLLYAWHQPEFVVDAYTKRIFSAMGFFDVKAGYMQVKELFENSLPRDVVVYQEYHALIVEHAKHLFRGKKN